MGNNSTRNAAQSCRQLLPSCFGRISNLQNPEPFISCEALAAPCRNTGRWLVGLAIIARDWMARQWRDLRRSPITFEFWSPYPYYRLWRLGHTHPSYDSLYSFLSIPFYAQHDVAYMNLGKYVSKEVYAFWTFKNQDNIRRTLKE